MTIKTVETENQGLKRAFMLTIPAADIEARVETEVKRLAPQVKMPGFRPGKVPPNLIRKMHGESLRGEALQGAVQDGVQQLLSEQKIRPAIQPQVELDQGYEPGKDAEITVRVEALPEVPAASIEDLKLDRLTVEADEGALDEQLRQLASSSKDWNDALEGHGAEQGDLVVIDFAGKVGGKAFDGGTGEDMSVEIGSGQLIPGFEDQLVGAKVGETRDLNVTFPENYPAEQLKGKDATFTATVKAVRIASERAVDEDFAKSLGLQDLDQLKGLIRDQQGQELNRLTRTHMKRQLLDQLANRHDFVVPESMVDAEYENIMAQLRHEAGHEEDPQAALAEIETDSADYRKIAERRVRLGLLLSEIGAANGVEINEQEMRALVGQAASQYEGKDREAFLRYIQQEPMAAAQLRAPLYEDKVVDFLFSKAEITDRPATRAELEADLESEEGHVHGPNCGHDHGAPAEKPKAKKASAKKKGETQPEAAPAAEDEAADDKPAEDGNTPLPTKAKRAKKADLVAEDAQPEPAKPLKSEPANVAAAEASDKKPAKKAPAKKKG